MTKKTTKIKKDNEIMAVNSKGLKYCILRSRSAGVFAGYVKKRTGTEATVIDARRLWYWEGAATLSELAMHGITMPDRCKFPCEVKELILTEVVEIIHTTVKAYKSIKGVAEWSARK